MEKIRKKLDSAIIGAQNRRLSERKGSDQGSGGCMIIAVAAGIAGLLYIFAKSTLLPNIQDKLTTLVNNWFNHS